MARTLISAVNPSRGGTGTDLTALLSAGNVDVPNGNFVPNDGKVRLLVKTTTADTTFTVQFAGSAVTIDGVAAVAPVYNLAANRTGVLIGPFDMNVYGPNLNINASQSTTTVVPIN